MCVCVRVHTYFDGEWQQAQATVCQLLCAYLCVRACVCACVRGVYTYCDGKGRVATLRHMCVREHKHVRECAVKVLSMRARIYIPIVMLSGTESTRVATLRHRCVHANEHVCVSACV